MYVWGGGKWVELLVCLMQSECACMSRASCGIKREHSIEPAEGNTFSFYPSGPSLSAHPHRPGGFLGRSVLCKCEEGFNFNLETHQNNVSLWMLLTGFTSKQSAERNKRSHLNVQVQITLGAIW